MVIKDTVVLKHNKSFLWTKFKSRPELSPYAFFEFISLKRRKRKTYGSPAFPRLEILKISARLKNWEGHLYTRVAGRLNLEILPK